MQQQDICTTTCVVSCESSRVGHVSSVQQPCGDLKQQARQPASVSRLAQPEHTHVNTVSDAAACCTLQCSPRQWCGHAAAPLTAWCRMSGPHSDRSSHRIDRPGALPLVFGGGKGGSTTPKSVTGVFQLSLSTTVSSARDLPGCCRGARSSRPAPQAIYA